MAINFPNSPAVNDTFTVGGINFTFTGVKWESGAVVELSSDTTPTLGGNLDGGAKNINNVGVITATGFSGSLTGNVTGNATGLTGNPSIQVTNATVLGNLDVQGTTSTIDTAITQVDSLAVEGSVGIGTTNPGTKLDVRGGNWANGDIVVGQSGNAGRVKFRRGVDGSDSGSIGFSAADNNSVLSMNVASGDGTLTFQTNSAERLRIESDGKLFIDRTHASATTGNHPALDIETHPNGTAGATFATGIDFRIAGVHKKRLAITNVDSNVGTGDWVFYQDNGVNEGLRITSAGRFGFNTGSPDAEVHIEPVTGGSNASIVLSNDGRSQWFRIQNNETDDAFTINANDTAERLRIDSSGNTTFSGTVSDSLGQVRKIPRLDKTTTYTITANDFGKVITADADITIPNNVMSVGDTITIIADGSGSISIIQDSGLVMYNSADGATGNRTLGLRGMATIWFKHPSYAYISGSQLS